MFVWSSQQSLPTQTQNLMEKNAIHSHKYSSIQILFIKTSSFFKANWSHWRHIWCFFKLTICLPLSPLTPQPLCAFCAPAEALKLMSSHISKGGQWSLRSISLTWNFGGHGLSMSFVPWAIVCHRPTHHTAHLWLKVMFHERLQQSELRLREDEMHPAQPQWDDKWHPTCYDHNSDSEPGSIICKVIVSANMHQASSDVMSTRNSTCC